MSHRNPFRFRKSEVQQPAAPSVNVPEIRPLPKPRNAREFIFRILDEHRITGEYISELIDYHLDRPQLSVLKNPPLAGFRKSAPPKEPERTERLSSLDRRFVTEIANGVVRRRQTIDAIIRAFTTRSQSQIEERLWTLLQIGTYQIIFMTSVPMHAAVGETVELAHFCNQHQWCPFLNGVLRSIAREVTQDYAEQPTQDRVPVQPQRATDTAFENRVLYRFIGRPVFADPFFENHRYVAEAFSLPTWLVDRWAERMGPDDLLRLAEWFSARQPMSLRVNRLACTRDELLAEFEDKLVSVALGCFGAGRRADSIWYDGPIRIVDLPGFSEGKFTVQDETAMSAAELLDPKPGEQIMDLCAAPGTKTTHLAELMDNSGQVLAVDVDSFRLQRVTDNAQRLKLSIIEPIMIHKDTNELPYGPFDGILIDVPCSNTGVLGKRPEVRTRLKPEDLTELNAIQMRLLTQASTRLKAGGRLVYSTCSIEPEENSLLVAQFLSTHPNFELVLQTEFIPGAPSDGGFQALLRKL